MSTHSDIDLSNLALPSVRQDVSIDVVSASASECASSINMESDARISLASCVLETFVMREEVLRGKMDQAARAVMLATSSGSALEQLSAIYGVKRMTLEPADPDATPPKEAVMEQDERLRMRTRLALQALSMAGCEGAYLFYAMSANPHLKDISVYNENHDLGNANVIVLSDKGRGDGSIGDDGILGDIEQVLRPVFSITDRMNVRWANIIDYKIDAEIDFYPDVDKPAVMDMVIKAVQGLVRLNHRLGKNILRDEFYAAMYQKGVERVNLIQPGKNQAVSADSAAYNSADLSDTANFRIVEARSADISAEAQVMLSIGLHSMKLLRLESIVKSS